MEVNSCGWAQHHPLEKHYHDTEWGIPIVNDTQLFEFITLEGAQAGLSWLTVLKKRDGYKSAFLDYDLARLAALDEKHVDAIIAQYDVIKHRGKIASVFTNAAAAIALQKEYGSLAAALWQFTDGLPINNTWRSMSDVPVSTDASKTMSKFLKKKGFKFVGETICYAFMQATGMVNDHAIHCECYQKVIAKQKLVFR
ncbi:DNA-3-methyladenine glycosylase I [Photobacterium swingsii]|uniref:DNA-3-methyladenine glycosylase I n=1 Tax=Photobacterium swingsii TaxID=680026 RepID=UPI0040689F07